MTDQEIMDAVRRYILGLHDSDNAGCLHEMDEFDDPDLTEEEFDDLIGRALAFYRRAVLTVSFPEEGQ